MTWAREALEAVREEEVSEEVTKRLLRAARADLSRAMKGRELDDKAIARLRERHEELLFELMKGHPPSWVLERVLASPDEACGEESSLPEPEPTTDAALDAFEPIGIRTVRFTLGELRTLRSTPAPTTGYRVEPIGMRPFGEPAPPPPLDPWWAARGRDAILERLGIEPPEGSGVVYEMRAAGPADARVLVEHGRSTRSAPKPNRNAKSRTAGAVLLVRRARSLKRAFLANLGHPDAAPQDFGARLADWTSELPDTLEITFEATLWSPLLTRRQLALLTERSWLERRPRWKTRERARDAAEVRPGVKAETSDADGPSDSGEPTARITLEEAA